MAAAAALTRTRQAAEGTAAFLAGAAAWTFVAALASGGDPLPVIGVLAACAVALVAAAAIAPGRPWLVPGLVVAAAAILAATSGTEILSSRPERGPFGYVNGTGAFYIQSTIAALMLFAASRGAWRWTGAVAAAVFVGIVLASGSQAAVALLLLPAAAIPFARTRMARAAVSVMTALAGVVLLGTIVVAVVPDSGVGGIFDERRRELWNEAVTAIGDRPLTGVGPGSFAEHAVSARRDADARLAHHGFLQIGAETGLPGMALVVLAFGWLFAGFNARPDPDAFTVLGAAALAAFFVGSCVDYLMHLPAIPVTAAALAGAATTTIDA